MLATGKKKKVDIQSRFGSVVKEKLLLDETWFLFDPRDQNRAHAYLWF